MSKNKSTKRPKEFEDKNLSVENIGDLCTRYMKVYGANTNLMRQIPAVADGLKPGERRILYVMHTEMPDRMVKVAKIVGAVIGSYHPHGDTSVADTLVKLAQPWNNIEPLIIPGGNFGNQYGDKAAAMRYIEAGLTKYAKKCFFEDFKLNYVNSKETFDGYAREPEYLPSRYPNILINHTFGIGYGVSTGMPTYNLQEVLELTIKLIKDPDHEDIVIYPDIPTGCDIVDLGHFEEICETGKGKLRMRGQIDIDEETNTLSIKSVPLHVTVSSVEETIIKLAKENKLQGIKHIEDDSSSEKGINMKIKLKKEVDPYVIRNIIFSKTDMDKTLPINFKLVDDYVENDYSIRSLLLAWIDFRREYKRIYHNHKLIESKERQHIANTMIEIVSGNNAEKSIRIIREAENKREIIDYLRQNFDVSSLQADKIADMKLSAFSKENVRKYYVDKDKADADVEKYNKIVRSNKKIDKIIIAELEEGIKLFGKPRKSRIITIDGEEQIRNTDHVVVFTLNGFVKKLPDDVKSIGHIAQGDYPIEITNVNNRTELLIFDETGKISKLPVHTLPNSLLTGEGERLADFCKIQGKITSIIPKPTAESLEKIKAPVYFVMLTKKGIIKKTLASSYVNIKNELLGLIVKEDDELKSVQVLVGDKDILVYTNKGFGIRFSSDDVRETNRMSIGVKALDIEQDEHVIGMDIVNEKDKYLFVLTNKGTGKKCTLDTFKTMERASKPLRIVSLDDNEEVMLIKTVKGTEKFKAYLRTSVEPIDINDVVELPRLSKGRKLFGVRKGETIIDIKEEK